MHMCLITLLVVFGSLSTLLTFSHGQEKGGGVEDEGDRQLRRLVSDEDATRLRTQTSGTGVVKNTTDKGLSDEEYRRRIRDQKRRLMDIQMSIWRALRPPPNMTAGVLTHSELEKIHAQYNRLQTSDRWKNENDYSSKKFFVLPPSCPASAAGVKHTWFATMPPFRLYFHVDATDDFRSSEDNVTSANLRLHIKPTSAVSGEHANKIRTHSDARKTRRYLNSPPSSSVLSSSSSSKDIDSTLVIYEYTKHVQRNKQDSKKYVRSVALRTDQSGWLSINLKNVVRRWYKHPNKNFGLLIELVNRENKILDARQVLDSYNCSSATNNQDVLISRSIPSGDNDDDDDDDDADIDTSSVEADVSEEVVTYPNLDIVIVQQQKQGSSGGAGVGGAGGKFRTVVVSPQNHTSRRHDAVERRGKTTTTAARK